MKWILTFAILIGIQVAAIASNIKVEPSCWWIGMENPNVQLMISGKAIGNLSPIIDYPGVKIISVTQVENQDYLFIDINIDQKHTLPGTFNISFKKNNKIISSYRYELLKRRENSSTRMGFSQSDVIYLITPDRFANAEPDNDSVKAMKEALNRKDENGRHGGDIQGIINHLDYISDMGFTALWLTPVLENNMPVYSYHGYSITDFYQTDPRMGKNVQYKELGDKAAQNGMKLIMDMVFNHIGDQHPWMSNPPTQDWISFKDAPVYTNHRKTIFQDVHVAPGDYQQMTDGWFSKTMPHLNQRNPLLAKYLIQNTLWWIEYANLSSIRVDTYPYPDMNFMSRWTKEIMEAYPRLNIVGEVWSENPALIAFWQKGKENKNGYTSYLPSLMDFPVQAALLKALSSKESNSFTGLYETIANDFQYANPDNLVVFADNHDIPRFYTLLHEDLGLYKLGMTFILTTRGIPQLLYGTEVLQTGESHGKLRSDFPGGWAGDPVNAFSGIGLTDDQKEAKAFIRKLLHWRVDAPSLADSKLMHYAPQNDVYVYFRYNKDHKSMIILNKSTNSQRISMSRFANMIASAKEGKEVLSGNKIALTSDLLIPAKSPLIIEW